RGMKMSFARFAAAACLAVSASPDTAQAAAPEYPNQIGPAVRSRPAYDGSKSQRADFVPILDYDNSLFFARTVQGVLEGGAHAQLGPGFTIGAQADLRATVGVYRNGPFQAGIFGQATWADHRSMRTYYGQPGFDASGGLLFASAGLLGSYDIDSRWAVIGSIEGRRLQGDAAR